jgi:hypothetical protein
LNRLPTTPTPRTIQPNQNQSKNQQTPADTYKAAVNVWARCAAVMADNADIVAATRAAFYKGGAINLTDEARPRVARLHAVGQTLQAAQLRLDALAALLVDFPAPGNGGGGGGGARA